MQSLVYNKNEATRRWIRIYILILLLIAQFVIIFNFSSQTATQSSSLSKPIMNKLEWLPESIPREKSSDGFMGVTLHYVIRKLAHMYNFFLVGCILGAIGNHFDKSILNKLLWLCIGFIAACIDESYQNFVPGRSGNVIDVLYDISGTLAGYIFVYVLFSVVFSKRCRVWKKKAK